MIQSNQIYQCSVCGNIIEILIVGKGEITCCGKSIELLEPKKTDEGQEKHVPVIEKTDAGVKVTVGSVLHPMEEGHYIQFIKIIADGQVYRQELKPGQAPEAEFCIQADNITAREYCNIHGLWTS